MWAIQILSAFVRRAASQLFTCAVLWVAPQAWIYFIWETPDSQNFGAPLDHSLSLFGSVPAAGVYSGLPVSLLLSLSPPRRGALPAYIIHPGWGARGRGWGNSLGLKWDADPFSVGLSILLFSPQPPSHLFRCLIQRSLPASTSGSLFVSFPYLRKRALLKLSTLQDQCTLLARLILICSLNLKGGLTAFFFAWLCLWGAIQHVFVVFLFLKVLFFINFTFFVRRFLLWFTSWFYKTTPSETGNGLRLVSLGWCVVIG